MSEQLWRFLVLVCAALTVSGAVHADADLVVGRADADASGGWPVALWVNDGQHAHFIVRAPREMLGELPDASWQPADADALMTLERFSAPRLIEHPSFDLCPSAQQWGRLPSPPSLHWPGEEVELRHAGCGAADCNLPAWKIDLPTGGDNKLPLARLMPRLAAQQPGWLVLYAARIDSDFVVSGMPTLQLAEQLPAMPVDAATRFPDIVTALVEHVAASRGLQAASVLVTTGSTYLDRAYIRAWHPDAKQRTALGLTREPNLSNYYMFRTLLRLQPGDLPAELQQRLVTPPQTQLGSLVSYNSPPVTPERCRAQLQALNCTNACANGKPWEPYVEGLNLEKLAPAKRTRACMKRCEQMKDGRFDAATKAAIQRRAGYQQDAWRDVEKLTGRSAASWQATR